MGYTTDFFGVITLNKKLSDSDQKFLENFNNTRRMARNLCEKKYGRQGEWYVEGKGMMGQDRENDIIDYNRPSESQPGLWCQWKPTDDGMGIEWDGGEKFYHAEEWMNYIIKGFLEPKGYVCNGVIDAQGEERGDRWSLIVENNKVFSKRGRHKTEASEIKHMYKITDLITDIECNKCIDKIKCAVKGV